MVALTWGTSGSRYYETGVDRGVLYLPNVAGVAWPGLISVKENVSGGDTRSYYIDGFKYLNIKSAEEFGASIEAFSSPREFDVCDGSKALAPGLFATQQVRKSFGFSYRTLMGNDVEGQDAGYKIHLVYNALASAPSVTYKTLDKSGTPGTISWDISTKALSITMARPTAHFIINSVEVPEERLDYLEKILYGSIYTDPRLPSIKELVEIINGVFGYKLEKSEIMNFFVAYPNVDLGNTSINSSNIPGIYTVPSYTNLKPVTEGIWKLE